jgi:hypothetical protein
MSPAVPDAEGKCLCREAAAALLWLPWLLTKREQLAMRAGNSCIVELHKRLILHSSNARCSCPYLTPHAPDSEAVLYMQADHHKHIATVAAATGSPRICAVLPPAARSRGLRAQGFAPWGLLRWPAPQTLLMHQQQQQQQQQQPKVGG